MKTKKNWVFIIAIGVMFMGALAFGPANVRAESNADAEGEFGLVEDGAEAEDLETQTSLTSDLVTPCRIVDTRNAGGFFFPGERREYYVYGPGGDIFPQGGNFFGCPAPRQEPRGVFINVTAVPVSGSGNFRVFPANVAPPKAGHVNYRYGEHNIANAGTFETYWALGPKEIELQNNFGYSHVTIDVTGYLDK